MMKNTKKINISVAVMMILAGAGLGLAGGYWLSETQAQVTSGNQGAEKKPLYWVAPMDANYRRDKPGKSPMGMDLIPVYEEGAAKHDQPGTVTISPAIENNLGVKTASVIRSPLSPNIETVGYIAFDESRLWQTNVRVSGWVQKLNINAVGETVRKGEVLFTLYSPDLIKAQEELLNAYRTKRSGLIKGATERLVTLGVDREQISHIVKQGKAQYSIEIKAVNDGIIASLNIREGGYLSPSQAVISAGPIDEVWVDAEVFERQGHWIKQDAQAVMSLDALPGQSWQGKVDYVYPILDPTTRTLRVRLKFKNDDQNLKPNMFANITLQPQTEESVLTIPRESVIRSGDMQRVVLSLGDGKFRSVRIHTGREAGERVEVLEGLAENDVVVTSAQFMLDSESSQNADLSRINGIDSMDNTAWADGEITDVMQGGSSITIQHQPVKEWNWPGMTMNFSVSSQVDLKAWQAGDNIRFQMKKQPDGSYEIVNIQAGSALKKEVWATGTVSLLMADFGMVTIQHQAIPDWKWSEGEMNFTVQDDVDLHQFQVGQSVRFLVKKSAEDYALVEMEVNTDKLSASDPQASNQHNAMNHEGGH